MRGIVFVLAAAACGGAEGTTQSLTAARSGRPLTAAELRPSSDGSPPLVAPSRLEPLRIAGELSIMPDDRSASLSGTFGFCLDESGKITSVTLLATTHDERYDARIIAAMHGWAYRPVEIDGRATAVCSRITFHHNH